MKNNLFLAAACLSIGVVGCAQPLNKSTQGALAGSALGAGLGAIVGSQSGHAGPGIAIGAAAGALGGALIGNTLDAGDQEEAAVRRQLGEQDRQLEENRRLIEELRKRGADVYGSRRGVVINLPDILFEFDRAELTREAYRTIGEISDVLRDVKGRGIAVEGHTDSVGTMIYNKRLSVDRARNVARALEGSGVSRAQLSVRGYGEGHPIATNNSDRGRARNRRVEVIIEN